MIKFKILIPAFLVIFLGFCNTRSISDEERIEKLVLQVLKVNHYNPQDINDEFSEFVYTTFVKRLDNGKMFMLQQDVDAIEKYKTQIDDQIKSGSFEFFNKAYEAFIRGVKETEPYYKEILSKPFDLTVNEEYIHKPAYSVNKNERKDNWRKSLKFNVMRRVYRKLDIQTKAIAKKDTSIKILSKDSLEARARVEELKSYKNWFKRLKRLTRDDMFNSYINTLTYRFDPHTNFFPPEQKEDFDIQMTGRLEGIGATLSEKDGYIRIVKIVPGSASYRQGELEAGDIILKVAQGEGEPLNVVDMEMRKAIKFIRGKKGTEVRLTVKKKDETIKVIPIIRDVVIIEAGYAKSAFTSIGEKKYGYISLPQFYMPMGKGGRTSHVDMRREINKLKAENIEGMVIDLRNNGGGSLYDCIKIAGLFLDLGPIVQVKSKEGKAKVKRDGIPGKSYEGPLVILTNHNSASASEILAAALQDHGRAVLLGTKSTHGKGTVQGFINLDRGRNKEPVLGQIKVTFQKFYRINGGSTQRKGVVPDIVHPDMYDHLKLGEKEYKTALKWDEIDAAKYNEPNKKWCKTIKNLNKQSQKRIKDNAYFNTLKKRSKWLEKIKDRKTTSLNLATYTKAQNEYLVESKLYKAVQKLDNPIVMNMPSVDFKALESDTLKLKIKKDWLKTFKNDEVLDEAFHVLGDME